MHKLVTLGLVEKLRNNDFILESKMAELKIDQRLVDLVDQPDRPEAV